MGKAVIKNRYPIYNEGKLLTSNNLNDSFDFLHSNLKFTRRLLFGQGIVSGLGYSYNRDEGITIHEGIAITEQGSIIQIAEGKTYRYCQSPNDKENEYLLVEDKESTNASVTDIKDMEDINEYFLGLRLYYNKTEDVYCSDKSCIVENDEVRLEIIPFITKTPYTEGKANLTEATTIPQIQAPVFKNIINYNILPIFLRKATNLFYKKTEAITKGLSDIANSAGIKEINKTISLENTEEKLNGVFSDVIEDISKIEFDNQNIPTYFSFADDMIEAINEFAVSCNRFLSRYSINANTKFEDSVILGKIQTIDDSRDTLKETYQDFGKIREQNIIIRLYKRIVYMVKCFKEFVEKENSLDIVNILPASSSLKLGERAIPFYYRQEFSILTEYWDAHNEQHIRNSESNPGMLDLKNADIYKISQYGSKNVVTDLTKQIYDYNLPIFIIQQEIYGDNLSFFLESYRSDTPNANDINETIEIIKSKRKFSSDCEKKIRDILTKYYKAYNVKEAAKRLGTITKESEIEEIWQSIYILIQENKYQNSNQMEESHKKLLSFIMTTILYHRIGDKLFEPNNVLGIDYIGGVEKRDIMLLITHQNKIMLCLNMPYSYYLINQERYKDKIVKNDIVSDNDLKNDFNPENLPEYIEEKQEKEKNTDLLDIYMLHYGRNKEHSANYLRERKKITFSKGMKMVNNLPALIFEGQTSEEAQRIGFILNERFKSTILITPSGKTEINAMGKLDFTDNEFDIEISYFEDEPQKIAEYLKKVTHFKTIEREVGSEGKETIRIKKVQKTDFLNKLDALMRMDAIFKCIAIQ